MSESDADGARSGRPGPSPWGEDAQRLLTAIQEWAQRTMPAPPSGHPGPECQWCPLCQLASVLRGEHPELAERIAEAGTALTGALRAMLDAAAKHVPAPADQARDRPSPGPHVEHIRLDEPG
jgi:DNA-binding HxlR family transcriptional regulator